MNPLLIESFQDELQKIATAQYVRRQLDEKVPEVRRLPSPTRRRGQVITAENLSEAVRRQYGTRAPRFAEDYARTAEEMAKQLREAGGDPSAVPVQVRPGMRDTVRELGLNRRGLRRRKGEPRIDRNVGGVPALPKDSPSIAKDRVNTAIFLKNKKTGKFDSYVQVSNRSPVTLAHELRHVADNVEASKPLGGRLAENLFGGVIGEEVAATRGALRTTYAKKNPAARAAMLAATGTYMEKQVDPLDIRRTSDSPRRTAELASRRAALRGPDPTYRNALSRSKKYRDLYRSLSRRESSLLEQQDALLDQKLEELSQLRNAAIEATDDDAAVRLVKKYEDTKAFWNKKIDKFTNENGKKLIEIGRAKRRAKEGARRNRLRYRGASPFDDPSLYGRMTPQEQGYIRADIKAYRENIARQFGPEDADLYARVVQEALDTPTGRGFKALSGRVSKALSRRL